MPGVSREFEISDLRFEISEKKWNHRFLRLHKLGIRKKIRIEVYRKTRIQIKVYRYASIQVYNIQEYKCTGIRNKVCRYTSIQVYRKKGGG